MTEEEIQFFTSDLSLYPEDSFEGLYEVFFDNGTPEYRGVFSKGALREGPHIEFWENGNVKELSYWRNGWIIGTALNFYENGVRETEIDYSETGSRDRIWTERSYTAEGELLNITHWNRGESRTEWIHPNYQNQELNEAISEETKRIVRELLEEDDESDTNS